VASIGEFTSERSAEEENPLEGLTFRLDKETFALEGHMSILQLSELARHAVGGEDAMKDAAASAMLAESLSQAFGAEEYDRFRKHVRDHGTPDEVVLAITAGINELVQSRVEEMTGRPTGQRSRSSRGRSKQEQRMSRVISLQTGDVQVVEEGGTDDPAQTGGPTLTGTVVAKPRKPPRQARPGAGRGRSARTA
jgi:hypothetical protein